MRVLQTGLGLADVRRTGVDVHGSVCFFFQAEDGIRDIGVTGVQTCALPIFDASFNAIANDDVQGAPLAEMPFEHFARPITKAMRNQFLTSRAVSRHMVERGSGVIMTITGGYREAFPNIGGTIVTWAAMEAQCRQWASELGPQGVRVV